MLENLRSPCENIATHICNEQVHNIIYNIIERYSQFYSPFYIGGLFDVVDYPIFEGKECIQYLQEFVPFHLPQIETVLSNMLNYFSLNFPNSTISVLDIGSGPATVALAFCRLFNRIQYQINLEITTVEASNTFNNMIDMYSQGNLNNNVRIVENIRSNFNDFMNSLEERKGKFINWVIMANFISAIGDSVESINQILNRFLCNLLQSNQQIMFTFIETRCQRNYTNNVDTTGFDNLRIVRIESPMINQKINAPWIMNCKFYKTKYTDHHYPYINSKSLLLEIV